MPDEAKNFSIDTEVKKLRPLPGLMPMLGDRPYQDQNFGIEAEARR